MNRRVMPAAMLVLVALTAGRSNAGDFAYGYVESVEDHGDSVTLRLGLHFTDSNVSIIAVHGTSEFPLVLATVGPILNDGGPFAGTYHEDRAAAPISGPFDSWVTLQADELVGNDTAFSPGFAGGDNLQSVVRGKWLFEDDGGWHDANPGTPVRPDASGDVLIAQITIGCSLPCLLLQGNVAWTAPGAGLQSESFAILTCDPGYVSVCLWDLTWPEDEDGVVGMEDLVQLLDRWGPTCDCCHCQCARADLDGDGDVGFADLLELLANWGPCAI